MLYYLKLLFGLYLVYFAFFVLRCYLQASKHMREKPIREFYKQEKSRKDYAPLETISETCKTIVSYLEDPAFRKHHGVNYYNILIAIKVNIQFRKYKRGASTITQQLAKNMYLSFEKTWRRKCTEMFIAWALEKVLSKDEILELYVNIINYGHGCRGIKPAAAFYFKKQPSELNAEESIALCAALQLPDKYNPFEKTGLPEKACAIKRKKLIRAGILK